LELRGARQHGRRQQLHVANLRGRGGRDGGASGPAGRVHHRHDVHVGQFLVARGRLVAPLLLLLLLLWLDTATFDNGVVVAGRREQVVRWRRRVGRVMVLLVIVPDPVHLPAQVTGVVQFHLPARVDRVPEEQLGARDHEKEQHQAAERGQVPYRGQRFLVRGRRAVLVFRRTVCETITGYLQTGVGPLVRVPIVSPPPPPHSSR